MEKLYNKSNIKKVGIASAIIIILALVIIPASFAQLTPIKSVEIPSTTLSYVNNEEGAWNITKSAKWISKGKARITIKLDTLIKPENDYTDVILVLDTSGSMVNGRLEQVKNDVIELINDTIPKGNNLALITFNDSSSIITDFTNDSSFLQDKINSLVATGETNYYQALVNVDTILKKYQKQPNRDCVVLFLTDGLPTADTPNEIAQYKYLKSTYTYLTINGIQYEIEDKPLEGIKNISDNQYIASMNTLSKFLYRAATSPANYVTFELTDYITSEHFNITDVSKITSSTGTISLKTEEDTQKVVWNLDGIKSGTDATLAIDINLNDNLIGVGGIYPTNESLSVKYQICSTATTEISTLTPILADNYLVTYDPNAPADCEITNMPAYKTASVFDNIKIEGTEPLCKGYKFKEWKLITDGITQVNEDYFIMPEKNVTLRAVWSKLNVKKSMNGKISKVQNLYQMMEDNSVLDNIKSEYVTSQTGINFQNNSSDTNGKGIYQDADTINDEYPVYYYRGEVNNNNLIFANFCWKIVRTTSTGGVKLIYNGEPTEDNQCLSTREKHIGYETKINKNLSNNYYYGTDYKYDKSTSTFKLVGEVTSSTWNDNTYNNLIEKYTCINSSIDENCTNLYQVVGYYNSTTAILMPINSTTHYSQIGKSKFNGNDNSPADVSYMYDTRYAYGHYNPSSTLNIYEKMSTSATSEYLYSLDIKYENEKYILQNTESKIWSDNYNNLVGYYTCRSLDNECTQIYYVAGTEAGYQYNIVLSAGKTLNDATITISENKTSNADGTYTLNTPIKIQKKDWYTDYDLYKNYYLCSDLTSTICEDKFYIMTTNKYQFFYEEARNYMYGNDITWDGNNYTLKDTIVSEYWTQDRETLATKYHYTCFSKESTCQNVYYIDYFGDESAMSYLTLTGGKNITDAIEEMYTNNINSLSTDIKIQIDNWYKENMIDYTDKIEDTVYCNDRSFASGALKSKDSSGIQYSHFGSATRTSNPSLKCPEIRDSFTTSSENGNGLLTYPVGLLTADEIMLTGGIGKKYYLQTGEWQWSMSPLTIGLWAKVINYTYGFSIEPGGNLRVADTSGNYGVRPSVSLVPGTRSVDGDGTEENPYIVE